MQRIKVTPEQVRAARLELQALESAGLTPDPMLRKLAAAGEPKLKKSRAPRKYRVYGIRSEAQTRRLKEHRERRDRDRPGIKDAPGQAVVAKPGERLKSDNLPPHARVDVDGTLETTAVPRDRLMDGTTESRQRRS